MEQHPLMRALRLDKCTTAVLEATFREYFCEKQAWENIPVLKMIARTKDELLAQAEEISWELNSCSCSGKNCSNREQRCDWWRLSSGRNNAGLCSWKFSGKRNCTAAGRPSSSASCSDCFSYKKTTGFLLEMRTISEEEKREFTAELKEVLDEK